MTSSEPNPYRQWHGNGPRAYSSKRLKEETFFLNSKPLFPLKIRTPYLLSEVASPVLSNQFSGSMDMMI